MGAILLLTIIIWVSTRKKIASIFAILFSLLPFHEFVKQVLINFTGSASFFPLWREIVILILLVNICFFKKKHYPNKQILFMLGLLSLVYSFFMFKGLSVDEESAVSVYRLEMMCILLFFCSGSIILKKEDINNVLKYVGASMLIVCVSGIIERFFLYYPLHLFMGHLVLGGNFITSSYEIMGVPRMCGIMSGPNQFGVTLGFWIPLIYVGYHKIKSLHNKVVLFLLCFMLVCLILSFSRAGWFLCFVSIAYITLKSKKYFFLYLLYAVVLVLVLYLLVSMLVPEAIDIINDSLAGKESSASTRGDFIEEGFTYFMKDPIGHGLGSGRISGKTLTESAAIIMLYEIGFLGVLAFILLYINVLFHNKGPKWNNIHKVTRIIVALSIVVWIVSVNFDEAPFMFYFWSLMGLSINKSFQKMKYI